jgi:excisionase family DNA binding protein
MTPAVPPDDSKGHSQAVPDAATSRRYLTVKELATATGLSVSTLRRLQRKGQLPFFQPGGPGTRVVYPLDAIEQAAQPDQASNHARTSNLASSAGEASPRRGPRPKWLDGTL